MTTTTDRTELSAEDRVAMQRFVDKHPDIYQRWLAARQARKVRQAELLQRARPNKS